MLDNPAKICYDVGTTSGRTKTVENEVFSHSRLNVAFECQQKYLKRHVLKQYTNHKLSYFLVGTITHQVIEHFYKSSPEIDFSEWLTTALRRSIELNFNLKTLDLLDTYNDFHKKALDDTLKQREGIKNPKATAYFKEHYEGALKALEESVDERVSRMFPGISFKKPFLMLYQQITKCLGNFGKMHLENPPNGKVHSEVKIVPQDLMGVKMGGKIDRVVEGDTLEVFDYKTGVSYWTPEGISNDDQIMWYSMACEKIYGRLPDLVGVWDLYHNRIVSHKLTRDDIDRFLVRIEPKITEAVALHKKCLTTPYEELKLITPITLGESYKCLSCEYAVDQQYPCEMYRKLNKYDPK